MIDSPARARPGRHAGLDQRGRPGQRARLAQQYLEVVIQQHRTDPLRDRPDVAGNLDPAVEDDDLRGTQQDPDLLADQPGGHRVVALADRHAAVAINARSQHPPRLEHLVRHGRRQRGLGGEVRADGASPALDTTDVLGDVDRRDALVQLREGIQLRCVGRTTGDVAAGRGAVNWWRSLRSLPVIK